MDPTKKEKLIKRLRYLWTGELFASFFLPAVVVFDAWLLEKEIGILVIYGTLCLDLILWQAAVYWRMKLEAVQNDQWIALERLRAYRSWKRINWVVLSLLPFVILLRISLAGEWQFNYDFWAGAALYILALLEQVNYYHYQLMYDYPEDWRRLVRDKCLKKPSLRRTLERLEDCS